MKKQKQLVLLEYTRVFFLILIMFEHFTLLCPDNKFANMLIGGSEGVLYFLLLAGFISRYSHPELPIYKSLKHSLSKLLRYYLYFVISILLTGLYQILIQIAQGTPLHSFLPSTIIDTLLCCLVIPTWFSDRLIRYCGAGWYFEIYVFCKIIDYLVQKYLIHFTRNFKISIILLFLLIALLNLYYLLPFMNSFFIYYCVIPRAIQYFIGIELYYVWRQHASSIPDVCTILAIILFVCYHLDFLSIRRCVPLLLIESILIVSLASSSTRHTFTYPTWLKVMRKHYFGLFVFHFIITKYWYMLPFIGSTWLLVPLSIITVWLMDNTIELLLVGCKIERL